MEVHFPFSVLQPRANYCPLLAVQRLADYGFTVRNVPAFDNFGNHDYQSDSDREGGLEAEA